MAANFQRLAPLDHVRNLYKEAEGLLPRDRPITRKQDLIRAVRAASPAAGGHAVHASASATALGSPGYGSPARLGGSKSAAGVGGAAAPAASLGVLDGGAVGDMDRLLRAANKGREHGVGMADAAETTQRTLREVEGAVAGAAKRFNELKRAAVLKEQRLADLRAELSALQAENATLAAVEARTHMLALSGGATKAARGGAGGAAAASGLLLGATAGSAAAAAGGGAGVDPKTGAVWSNPWDSDEEDDGEDEEEGGGSGGDAAYGLDAQASTGSLPALRSAAAGGAGSSPRGRAAAAAAAPPNIGLPLGFGGPLGSTLSNTSSALLDAAEAVMRHTAAAQAAGRGGGAVDAAALRHITPAEAAEVSRIRQLRRQIRTVRRAMTRREFTRRQYEHMSARLRSNASAFERHMKGLDDAIRAARKETGDVSGYLRLLEASRDGAIMELHRLQGRLASERAARERDLEERRVELARATKMEAWRRQRAAVRAEMKAELAGDLSREQEEQLLHTLAAKEAAVAQLQQERRQREERAAALQDAFTRIKATTGVATLEQMVDRFLGAPRLREALESERSEAEARLAAVRREHAASQAEYEALQGSGGVGAALAQLDASQAAGALLPQGGGRERAGSSLSAITLGGGPSPRGLPLLPVPVPAALGGVGPGVGGEDSWREELSRLERLLAGARAQLRLHRSGADRLEEILLSVRQGALGLASMLEPLRELLAAQLQQQQQAAGAGAGGSDRSPSPAGGLQAADRRGRRAGGGGGRRGSGGGGSVEDAESRRSGREEGLEERDSGPGLLPLRPGSHPASASPSAASAAAAALAGLSKGASTRLLDVRRQGRDAVRYLGRAEEVLHALLGALAGTAAALLREAARGAEREARARAAGEAAAAAAREAAAASPDAAFFLTSLTGKEADAPPQEAAGAAAAAAAASRARALASASEVAGLSDPALLASLQTLAGWDEEQLARAATGQAAAGAAGSGEAEAAAAGKGRGGGQRKASAAAAVPAVAEALLSRARALRSLSAATAHMLAVFAAGGTGSGPDALSHALAAQAAGSGRPGSGLLGSSRAPAFGGAAGGGGGISLPPVPVLPPADVDTSLAAVSLRPGVQGGGSGAQAGAAAGAGGSRPPRAGGSGAGLGAGGGWLAPPVHVNNIRVAPQPRLDPRTGQLIEAGQSRHGGSAAALLAAAGLSSAGGAYGPSEAEAAAAAAAGADMRRSSTTARVAAGAAAAAAAAAGGMRSRSASIGSQGSSSSSALAGEGGLGPALRTGLPGRRADLRTGAALGTSSLASGQLLTADGDAIPLPAAPAGAAVAGAGAAGAATASGPAAVAAALSGGLPGLKRAGSSLALGQQQQQAGLGASAALLHAATSRTAPGSVMSGSASTPAPGMAQLTALSSPTAAAATVAASASAAAAAAANASGAFPNPRALASPSVVEMAEGDAAADRRALKLRATLEVRGLLGAHAHTGGEGAGGAGTSRDGGLPGSGTASPLVGVSGGGAGSAAAGAEAGAAAAGAAASQAPRRLPSTPSGQTRAGAGSPAPGGAFASLLKRPPIL